MGRSTYLNVGSARTQEAYYAKIRDIVFALRAGQKAVPCPRVGCGQTVRATRQGIFLTLRCPNCGLLYRGSEEALMSHYEP